MLHSQGCLQPPCRNQGNCDTLIKGAPSIPETYLLSSVA